MVKLIAFLSGITLFSVLLWENLDQKVTIKVLGSSVIENVPVLILILLSLICGMLVMVPVMWYHLFRQRRRLQQEAGSSSPLKPEGSRASKAKDEMVKADNDSLAADAANYHRTVSKDDGSPAG